MTAKAPATIFPYIDKEGSKKPTAQPFFVFPHTLIVDTSQGGLPALASLFFRRRIHPASRGESSEENFTAFRIHQYFRRNIFYLWLLQGFGADSSATLRRGLGLPLHPPWRADLSTIGVS